MLCSTSVAAPRFRPPMDERCSARPHYWLDKRWKRYVVSPTHGPFWYADSPKIPNDSGVYFLWGEDFGLLYVGQSLGVRYRVQQHRWAGRIPLAYVTCVLAEPDIIPIIENVYIYALEPPMNNKADTIRWAGHRRMERIVRRLWRSAERGPTPAHAAAQPSAPAK